MKSIDQTIFDAIYKVCLSLGLSTFDTLPALETDYPFAVIGATQTVPTRNKMTLAGRQAIDVHVWAESNNRRWVSDQCEAIMAKVRRADYSGSYHVQLVPEACSVRVLEDTSTDKSLWHGVLMLEFEYIKTGGINYDRD